MAGKKGMRHYPESLKEQIRQEHKTGASLTGLQRKYGVRYWSIHCWCGRSEKVNICWMNPCPKGRPRKNPESQEQIIRRLKMENELLRNFVIRWKEVKPRLKYRLIEQYSGKYPIQNMCKFYAVSHSGYYRYLKHKEIPAKDVSLATMIAE